MLRDDFLKDLISPIKSAVLKKFPDGHIRQYWADNPSLYSNYFGQKDDLHKFMSGHTGVDIATTWRDEVRASHSGTVSRVKTDRSSLGGIVVYINSPVVQDKGEEIIFSTAYAHLDQAIVKEGQYIKQGDVIGYEGNTGFVISGNTPYWGDAPGDKGLHLHFSLYEFIKKGGAWVKRRNEALAGSLDPLPWITGDLSGWLILLENMKELLLHWSNQLNNK